MPPYIANMVSLEKYLSKVNAELCVDVKASEGRFRADMYILTSDL